MHSATIPLELLATVRSPGSKDSSELLPAIAPWLGALLGLVIVGAVALTLVRKYLRAERPRSEGFTLQELRDLHRDGALSDEEFERAKIALIGRLKAPRPATGDAASQQPPSGSSAGP